MREHIIAQQPFCYASVDARAHAGPAGLVARRWARDGLDGVSVPYHVSTSASAASVWGSQKVMSMARYRSIAIDSSVRACSH